MADPDTKRDDLLTFGAYARHRGISQPRVSQLVAAGKIPVVWLVPGDAKSSRIDRIEADAALERNQDPSSPSTGHAPQAGAVVRPAGAAEGFAAARTRTELAREEEIVLRVRRAKNELVEKESVERAIFDANTAIAKTLDTMPDRVAGLVAAETDLRRVRAILLDEVNKVREQIADGAQQLKWLATQQRGDATVQ